jgi:hypothetical protein
MFNMLAWFRYWYVLDFEPEVWALIVNYACFACFGNVVSLRVSHLECVYVL